MCVSHSSAGNPVRCAITPAQTRLPHFGKAKRFRQLRLRMLLLLWHCKKDIGCCKYKLNFSARKTLWFILIQDYQLIVNISTPSCNRNTQRTYGITPSAYFFARRRSSLEPRISSTKSRSKSSLADCGIPKLQGMGTKNQGILWILWIVPRNSNRILGTKGQFLHQKLWQSCPGKHWQCNLAEMLGDVVNQKPHNA